MKPVGYVRQVVQNQVTRDTSVLYASDIAAGAIALVVSLIVARELGPAEFGVVTAYQSIIFIVTGFTDFGLGTGLIKFTSPLLRSDPERANPYFRATLYAELLAGALVLLAGLTLSGALSSFVGEDLEDEVVVLAVVSAAVTSSAAYVPAALAAHKRFGRNAIWTAGVAGLRLLCVLSLWAAGELSLANVLYTFAAVSFVSVIAGYAITPRDYLNPVPPGSVMRAARDIFRISGWLTLTFFITAVMGRLDFFFLYKLEGREQAGVYAAAIQLSMVVSLLIAAITTVLTPHVSERIDYRGKIDFLRQVVPAMLLGAAVLALSALFVPFVVRFLFGPAYADAGVPLAILTVHLALHVILIPLNLILIPFGKVRYGTFVSALQMAIGFGTYPLLIDAYGANGAALAILLNTILALALYPLIVRRLLRRERSAELEVEATLRD